MEAVRFINVCVQHGTRYRTYVICYHARYRRADDTSSVETTLGLTSARTPLSNFCIVVAERDVKDYH